MVFNAGGISIYRMEVNVFENPGPEPQPEDSACSDAWVHLYSTCSVTIETVMTGCNYTCDPPKYSYMCTHLEFGTWHSYTLRVVIPCRDIKLM